MPIIHTIDSIKIYICFFDHAPPHFHAEYNEYEELIDIRTLEVLKGELPRKQHKKVISGPPKIKNNFWKHGTSTILQRRPQRF